MDWSRLSNTDTFYQISGLTLLASLLSLILTFILW
ncbi:unknown [Firmicutes bacterium CAG:631]|nr:unknown [Firmicutes bacterium CAG:631]